MRIGLISGLKRRLLLDSRSLRALAVALVISATLVLPGCNDQKTRDLIDQRAADAQQSMTTMDHYAPAKRYNPLVVTDKVWTGSSALRMHRGLPLPARFETEHGIALVSSDPMSLEDIATAISTQTGISVRLSDVGVTASNSAKKSANSAMPIAYEGPLSGLMEKVAGYFGVNWRYDGATISVARFETRVFVIEALPGTQNVTEGMQDDSGSSSSGGGGAAGGSTGGSGGGSSTNSITQNSKFTIDLKYWDELNQTLTAMIAGTGTVVTAPSDGTVTVSTTPEVMRSVAEYIAQENDRLSRQIAITVEIYSVNLTEGSDFNVAFNTILRRLTNFGGNLVGVGAPPTPTVTGAVSGGGALSIAILNPQTIGAVTDIFTALSGIGDTTKVAKFPLVTLNNRPVSRRIGEDINYVAESTTANTTTGSTSNLGTSVVPGTIHQGFSVQLTPRLLDDGRILLQYSLSVIDVKSIATFNSQCGDVSTGTSTSCPSGTAGATGSSTVQLPDTINSIFVQQSVLKSGSMLLLGGAEQEDLQHNAQGVGDPFFYGLGGGTSVARSHTMLFMAITPQVLNEPHTEQE